MHAGLGPVGEAERILRCTCPAGWLTGRGVVRAGAGLVGIRGSTRRGGIGGDRREPGGGKFPSTRAAWH